MLRRVLCAFIFLCSYHTVLSRSVPTVHAAGFRLAVRPTVFHPSLLDLTGKRVIDIGPGPASWRWRRRVPAPRASTSIRTPRSIAAENAHATNGFAGRITGLCSNLLAALALLIYELAAR